MTLIAGILLILLPRVVLLVSDTRLTGEITGEILLDYKRKITIVTPNFVLGRSGYESNGNVANILRECLHNNSLKVSSAYLRMCVRTL